MLLRIAPALFVFLWSSGFIGTKLAVSGAEPFTFLSIRYLAVLSILIPVALYLARPALTARQAAYAMIAGALLHGGYLGGVTWGVSAGMDANVTALICSLQPILTAVLAGLALSERVTLRHWAGLALGLAGTLLVIVPKLGAIGPLSAALGLATPAATALGPIDAASLSTAGVAAVFFGLLAITSGTIWQKRYGGGYDMVSGAVWQFLGAFLVTVPLSFIFETQRVTWTPGFVFALVWLVFVLSLGAISLLMLLIRENAVSRTSALFYLTPSATSIMAFFIFGETLSAVQIIGFVLVTLAVIWMQQPDATPTSDRSSDK